MSAFVIALTRRKRRRRRKPKGIEWLILVMFFGNIYYTLQNILTGNRLGLAVNLIAAISLWMDGSIFRPESWHKKYPPGDIRNGARTILYRWIIGEGE